MTDMIWLCALFASLRSDIWDLSIQWDAWGCIKAWLTSNHNFVIQISTILVYELLFDLFVHITKPLNFKLYNDYEMSRPENINFLWICTQKVCILRKSHQNVSVEAEILQFFGCSYNVWIHKVYVYVWLLEKTSWN